MFAVKVGKIKLQLDHLHIKNTPKYLKNIVVNQLLFLGDNMGKCTRCGRYSEKLEENVWLKPEMHYLCDGCRLKWFIIFKTLDGSNREVKKKEFKKFISRLFIFR
jgi:hypothetical protein